MLSEDSPNASRFRRKGLSDKLADDFTGGALSLVGSNNVDGGHEAFERAWKMRVLVTSILALTAVPTSLSAGPTVSRCPFGRLRRRKLVLARAGRGNRWETNLRNRWASECLYPSAPTFINDFWTGTVPRARPYTCSSGGCSRSRSMGSRRTSRACRSSSRASPRRW